jgi:hypothetical protein
MGIFQKKEIKEDEVRILTRCFSASRPINYDNPPSLKGRDLSRIFGKNKRAQ